MGARAAYQADEITYAWRIAPPAWTSTPPPEGPRRQRPSHQHTRRFRRWQPAAPCRHCRHRRARWPHVGAQVRQWLRTRHAPGSGVTLIADPPLRWIVPRSCGPATPPPPPLPPGLAWRLRSRASRPGHPGRKGPRLPAPAPARARPGLPHPVLLADQSRSTVHGRDHPHHPRQRPQAVRTSSRFLAGHER